MKEKLYSQAEDGKTYRVTYTIDELQLLIAPYVKPKYQEKFKAELEAYTTNKIIDAYKKGYIDSGLDRLSPKQTPVATKSVSDTCTLCGASPMTANCNNAGCS